MTISKSMFIKQIKQRMPIMIFIKEWQEDKKYFRVMFNIYMIMSFFPYVALLVIFFKYQVLN